MAAGCVFCAIVDGRAPASVVARTDVALAFMDHRPFRPGHVLVAPRAHGQRLADVAPADVAAVFALATEIAAAVRASGLPCDDVNLFVNDGPAAGQTVAHLHVHVVPRVRGDLWRAAAILPRRVLPPVSRARLDDDAAKIAGGLARQSVYAKT
jgi:diadenosine tetraphosphate (Ap4A) HIT family hydrolase